MAGGTSTPGEGTLDRTLRILGCFTEDDPSLTQVQIVRRSGLAQATVSRLLADLTRLGLVDERSRSFSIGARLWEFGELAPLSIRLRETALPHLIDLYETSGENVHLGVLSDTDPSRADTLFVARLAGTRSVPTLSRTGGRHVLHATGVGKALLATRDEAWLDAFLRRPLERETVFTITDASALRRNLAAARERGYAITKEEMSLGNYSLGVALPPIPGLPPIAIGLVSHLAKRDVQRYVRQVQASADAIASDLLRHH